MHTFWIKSKENCRIGKSNFEDAASLDWGDWDWKGGRGGSLYPYSSLETNHILWNSLFICDKRLHPAEIIKKSDNGQLFRIWLTGTMAEVDTLCHMTIVAF